MWPAATADLHAEASLARTLPSVGSLALCYSAVSSESSSFLAQEYVENEDEFDILPPEPEAPDAAGAAAGAGKLDIFTFLEVCLLGDAAAGMHGAITCGHAVSHADASGT